MEAKPTTPDKKLSTVVEGSETPPPPEKKKEQLEEIASAAAQKTDADAGTLTQKKTERKRTPI